VILPLKIAVLFKQQSYRIAIEMFSIDSSFCRYTGFADICSGSSEMTRQITVGLSYLSIHACSTEHAVTGMRRLSAAK